MGASGGPAIVSANLKLAIDPADNVCNGGKSVMSDLVGSYDGTLYSGNSVKFDASDDYIACGSDTSIDMAIGDSYSITCWIKKLGTNSGNYAHILDNYCTLRNWSVGNWVNTDQLFFEWRRADNLAWTATQLSLNLAQEEWNFLAITVTSAGSGGTKTIVTRLYNSNGAPSTSTKTTTDDWSNSGTGNFNIGRSQSNGTYFNGEVSDVRVYKKVLSADEIGLIYNKPNIVLPPDVASSDLVGWWPLIDGSGTTANDYSGNDNNGTLTNGPIWVSGSATIPQTTTGFEHTASLEPSSNAGWLEFNGRSDSITITNTTDLRISNPGSATIGVWILIDDASDVNGIIGPWSSTGNAGWGITGGYPDSALSMIVDDGGDASGHWVRQNTPKVTLSADGKFHYVVVTAIRNGVGSDATLSHYLDGMFYNSITFSNENGAAAWGAAGQDFLIGKLGDNYLDGKVSTAHMYNRILSSKEISQNYNAMKSRFT